MLATDNLVNQTHSSGGTYRLEIISAPPKGSVTMPIPFLSQELPDIGDF